MCVCVKIDNDRMMVGRPSSALQLLSKIVSSRQHNINNKHSSRQFRLVADPIKLFFFANKEFLRFFAFKLGHQYFFRYITNNKAKKKKSENIEKVSLVRLLVTSYA